MVASNGIWRMDGGGENAGKAAMMTTAIPDSQQQAFVTSKDNSREDQDFSWLNPRKMCTICTMVIAQKRRYQIELCAEDIFAW